MKTVEEIKNIWKKSVIETFTDTFTIVEETAKEESLKPDINVNNIQACMSNVRDRMEKVLESHGITAEDKPVLLQHQEQWTKESMPWIMDLILDKMKLKETLIKKGGKYDA